MTASAATTVTRIDIHNYLITRVSDGVQYKLHAVNASLTGWSIKPVTPGYAKPGQWLFKDAPQERMMGYAQDACERGMTHEQVRELEVRHADARLAYEAGL